MGLNMADEVTDLFRQIRGLILSARNAAFRSVDTIQVFTNYEVGRLIVEHEQQGARRAGCGQLVLKELSRRLADEFGRVFSLTNLKLMRKFYLLNKERIVQTPSGELLPPSIGQTLSDQLTRHGCRR